MIQITCSMEVEQQLWNLKCSRHVAQSRRWGYHCRLFWCLDPNDQCYDGQLRSLKGCSSELQSFLPTIAKNPFYIHFVSYLFLKQNIFGIGDFNYFSNTLLKFFKETLIKYEMVWYIEEKYYSKYFSNT